MDKEKEDHAWSRSMQPVLNNCKNVNINYIGNFNSSLVPTPSNSSLLNPFIRNDKRRYSKSFKKSRRPAINLKRRTINFVDERKYVVNLVPVVIEGINVFMTQEDYNQYLLQNDENPSMDPRTVQIQTFP